MILSLSDSFHDLLIIWSLFCHSVIIWFCSLSGHYLVVFVINKMSCIILSWLFYLYGHFFVAASRPRKLAPNSRARVEPALNSAPFSGQSTRAARTPRERKARTVGAQNSNQTCGQEAGCGERAHPRGTCRPPFFSSGFPDDSLHCRLDLVLLEERFDDMSDCNFWMSFWKLHWLLEGRGVILVHASCFSPIQHRRTWWTGCWSILGEDVVEELVVQVRFVKNNVLHSCRKRTVVAKARSLLQVFDARFDLPELVFDTCACQIQLPFVFIEGNLSFNIFGSHLEVVGFALGSLIGRHNGNSSSLAIHSPSFFRRVETSRPPDSSSADKRDSVNRRSTRMARGSLGSCSGSGVTSCRATTSLRWASCRSSCFRSSLIHPLIRLRQRAEQHHHRK